MQVKHLMLLLGGGTAQRTRRRRIKVIMPLNLNSKWDQIKREDHAANKAQTQKRKPSLKFYLVWWDSRSMKPVEPTLMKRLWCSSEHRCQRESESADAEAGSISKLVSPSWRGGDHAIFCKNIFWAVLDNIEVVYFIHNNY